MPLAFLDAKPEDKLGTGLFQADMVGQLSANVIAIAMATWNQLGGGV